MRPQHGSTSLELVLITPALLVLLAFVVFVGRLAQARAEVDAAARDAARAASLARSADGARSDGAAAAEATISHGGVTCRHLDVHIDTAGFVAGGAVDATVTCAVDLGDLSGLGVPGSRSMTSKFSESVDLFRGLDQ